MTTVKDFFAWSDWVQYYVLRPLSHIRSAWDISWDHATEKYDEENDSFGNLLNNLIEELDACAPPTRYHDHEDELGIYVQQRLKWDIKKAGFSWVRADGSRLQPLDYIVMLEQGGFDDLGQAGLVKAAAGRIQAAINRGQNHFDEMEDSHMYMLAGVLSAILYHRDATGM